jgi:hypothetical protein
MLPAVWAVELSSARPENNEAKGADPHHNGHRYSDDREAKSYRQQQAEHTDEDGETAMRSQFGPLQGEAMLHGWDRERRRKWRRGGFAFLPHSPVTEPANHRGVLNLLCTIGTGSHRPFLPWAMSIGAERSWSGSSHSGRVIGPGSRSSLAMTARMVAGSRAGLEGMAQGGVRN